MLRGGHHRNTQNVRFRLEDWSRSEIVGHMGARGRHGPRAGALVWPRQYTTSGDEGGHRQGGTMERHELPQEMS